MTKRTKSADEGEEKVETENLEEKTPSKAKEGEGELETFNFPLEQRSVQAKNLQEAEKKINKPK